MPGLWKGSVIFVNALVLQVCSIRPVYDEQITKPKDQDKQETGAAVVETINRFSVFYAYYLRSEHGKSDKGRSCRTSTIKPLYHVREVFGVLIPLWLDGLIKVESLSPFSRFL